MSADEARILIVDDQREVARVLRTALELSGRGYIVFDVPSGEEAMLELGREFDVIIVDYRLPGISGPELLQRVRNVQSGVKGILMTGSPLDQVRQEVEERDVELFDLLEKPIDTDRFVELVSKALHGDSGTALPQITDTSPLGPIPDFDAEAIEEKLEQITIDLGAQGIAFITRGGKILLKKGAIDDVPRFGELAVLLASNFTTTAEIATYLGENDSTALHYYDGDWYDIFALSVGAHFFITVVYPGGSQKQMGIVLRYGKSGVNELLDIIGGDTGVSVEYEDEFASEPDFVDEDTIFEEEYEEEALLEDEPEEFDERELEDVASLSLIAEGEEIEALDLDLDALGFDLSEGADADMGDLDDFWEEAGAEETKVSDDALSMEEAVELGLIPRDKEMEED